jgi:GcrA cell cycle regulator
VSRPLISRWDKNTIAKLRRYWRAGLSATEIAQALGKGLTRSAVLGQVKRMRDRGADIGPRVKAIPPPRASAVVTDVPPNSPLAAPIMPAETIYDHIDPSQPGLLRILDLKNHHCRWPLNNALGGEFYFCGAQREHKRVYCASHNAIAYKKGKQL